MAESGSGSETQMRDTELFQAALGLGTPWSVSGSRFDAAARRLDIEITFAKGARFACPACVGPLAGHGVEGVGDGHDA